MRFDPYIPHYYLGVALSEQGDCAGALEAWQVSESQGFITKLDQYADLEERRERCRQRIARVEPTPVVAPTATARPDVTAAVQAARSRIEAAETAAGGLSALRSDERYRAAWNADPNLGRRADQASTTLKSARTRLEAGERAASEDDLAEALRLADRAAGEFAAIRTDLDRQRQQLALRAEQQRDQEAALQRAREDVATAAAAAREMLQRPDVTAISSQEGRRQRGQLESLLRQADGAATVTSLTELRELRQGISSATTTLERTLVADASRLPTEVVGGPTRVVRAPTEPTALPSTPPQRLRIAAEAFFSGDYQQTLSLLDDAAFSDRRAVAASHLLRAGAQFSLFLAGGEEDDGLRRSALEEVRSCRRVRAEITLDPSLFSPRFAEFVSSVR
jgi:hypothetical protein